MRMYYAGLADIRMLVHDVFRHGASPCRPTFRRTPLIAGPVEILHVMVFMVAVLLIPGAACYVRAWDVVLDRGPPPAPREPASTFALDCPQVRRDKEIGKSFWKTTIRANVFSTRHANFAAIERLLHFGRVDCVSAPSPLVGETCIAVGLAAPGGTRGQSRRIVRIVIARSPATRRSRSREALCVPWIASLRSQ
jgi:hypothetical protein